MTRSLFVPEIPSIQPDENAYDQIEVLKSQFSHYNDYYVVSAALADRKKYFEDLWQKYEPYADGDFVEQAQKRFHQKTWEMYMGNVLLSNGFVLARAGRNAPDLKINHSERPNVWIECVCPEKGAQADRVPEMVYGMAVNVPEEEMLLRITNSFEEKSKKFQKYIEDGVVNSDEPRIIAINRADLDHVDSEPPLIIKALFAVGHLALRFNPDRSEVTERFYTHRPKLVKKSGGEVLLGHFLDDKHKHISAVIYTDRTVLNRPEYIGSECLLIHNPHAEVPLPVADFSFMQRYVGKDGVLQKLDVGVIDN